jgi:hypothetical protein
MRVTAVERLHGCGRRLQTRQSLRKWWPSLRMDRRDRGRRKICLYHRGPVNISPIRRTVYNLARDASWELDGDIRARRCWWSDLMIEANDSSRNDLKWREIRKQRSPKISPNTKQSSGPETWNQREADQAIYSKYSIAVYLGRPPKYLP